MIKKISKLVNIGRFVSINQNENFKFGDNQNCNIVFGFNGSGKTTISNAISFFANDSFISEDEKKEIYEDIKNSDDSVIELELQGSSTIKYPSTTKHSKNIYIFNSNFVLTHVFDGTKGKIKKFSNVGGEIKNKEIDDINKKIDEQDKEKIKLENENLQFREKHKILTSTKSASFSKTLTDSNKRLSVQDIHNLIVPKEDINKLEEKLSSLSNDYDLSKKLTELDSDVSELQNLNFGLLSLNFAVIDDLLSRNVQQISKQILEEKIKEIQNLFQDDPHKQSVERWLKFGKEILENTDQNKDQNCPICNTDISENLKNILASYEGYFDETYENFINDLKHKIAEISTNITQLEDYEKDTCSLEKIKNKYSKITNELVFEKYDFTEIKTDFEKLFEYLEQKNNNIQNSYSKPEKIETNIKNLNSNLQIFQKLKDDILIILNTKKLDTHTIESQIRQVYSDIIAAEFNQTDKNGALEIYKNNEKRIETISSSKTEGIPFLMDKLQEEIKKIKTESKSISKYLNKMGIDNFDIDINENKIDENIIIKYKSSPNTKDRLKNCLSEGEKTALAFAYFLSKFENEVNNEEQIKDSTVVIDDPISSLDENRLYSTANLLWKNFIKVKQLIVLSHDFLFLKFFNSFYKGKANCLFLDQNKLVKIPDELKNFETPYYYMLRKVIDFIDENNLDVTYNEAKRYLPNFIRRILETFLSFKFSRIVDRNGGYRSPGLGDFDDNIDNTDMEEGTKQDLKEQIAEINRIADAHSHGNAHHTQESFYISETDLKTLAQKAINVIKTMDTLHETSFVYNHNQTT